MWSNFHTHSEYCDGTGPIREYLEAAQAAGVKMIGFSSHAPLPFFRSWSMKAGAFAAYRAEIESLKPLFPDIEVYKGLEVDFIPGLITPADFSPLLDYTVGSIHFVDAHQGRHWEIDNTFDVFQQGLDSIFDGDIRRAIGRYYALTREMLTDAPPDILGHLDKIKINAAGRYFEESESWYRDEVDKTLDSVVEAGTIVEVNTRGLYKKKSSTPYPSPWILERIHQRGIRVTLSSDAHHSQDLTREFGPTLSLLRDIGFNELAVLHDGSWQQMPVEEYVG